MRQVCNNTNSITVKKIIIFLCVLCMALPLSAQHVVEAGAGWGDMGMTPSTGWKPYSWSQGSRKEAQAFASYKYMLGKKRIYYVPSVRLQYDNVWSLSGSMNLLNVNLGLAGLGVHLTKPIYSYEPADRKGKWCATFEINFASIAIGGNITPHMGVRGSNSGVRMWIDPDRQFGNQYYPIADTYEANDGRYLFLHYSVPVEFRVWRMVTEETGIGFFLGSDIAILEKDFTHKTAPVAMGYNIYGGVAVSIFK